MDEFKRDNYQISNVQVLLSNVLFQNTKWRPDVLTPQENECFICLYTAARCSTEPTEPWKSAWKLEGPTFPPKLNFSIKSSAPPPSETWWEHGWEVPEFREIENNSGLHSSFYSLPLTTSFWSSLAQPKDPDTVVVISSTLWPRNGFWEIKTLHQRHLLWQSEPPQATWSGNFSKKRKKKSFRHWSLSHTCHLGP